QRRGRGGRAAQPQQHPLPRPGRGRSRRPGHPRLPPPQQRPPAVSGPPEAVVGRLAPSPTGAQHGGHPRTHLLAWLSARGRGGRVVLRIEDIDSPRVKAGAAAAALEDLRWLGLDWDGAPLVQTARLEEYRAALERLRRQELVYPCTCTRG